GTTLFVDGEVADTGPGWTGGMTGNTEQIVIGGSNKTSAAGTTNQIRDKFDGRIDDVTFFDRPLEAAEAFLFAENGELPAPLPAPSPVAEVVEPDMPGSGETTPGDDRIIGTEAGESLDGSGGHDTIDGKGGDDEIFGGTGDDLMIGGAGSDSFFGGAGEDTVSYEGEETGVGIDLYGMRISTGAAEGDVFDAVENVIGTEHRDKLLGSNGENEIYGGGGIDIINGRGGIDIIYGGAGPVDVLIGSRGADVMTGGEGRDRYVYVTLKDSGVGDGERDIITDFEIADNDRIELSRLDADITQGGNQVFDLISQNAFSATAGELRIDLSAARTLIQADVDGDGEADLEIELTGQVDLDESSFVL
ncbi:MAG: hypothetical protein AAF568_04610, partial [Pseudomonadota bacterium]